MPINSPGHVRLASHDIDLHHNWSAAYQNYVNIKPVNFIEKNQENVRYQGEDLQCTYVTFYDQQNKVLHEILMQIFILINFAIIQKKKVETKKKCMFNEMVH